MRNEKREERNFNMEVLTVIGAVALVVIIAYLINTRAQIPPVPYGYTKVVESVVIEDKIKPHPEIYTLWVRLFLFNKIS